MRRTHFVTPRALALALPLLAACPQQQPPPRPPPAEPAPVVVVAEHPWPRSPRPRPGSAASPLIGASLAVIAHLEPDPAKPGAWRGRIDIPMQGVKDFPLQNVDLTPEGLETSPSPRRARARPSAPSSWSRANRTPPPRRASSARTARSFPLELRRLAPGESLADLGPKRPQEPKPPYPYSVRDASFFTSPVDNVTLTGSFTAPATPGKHAAVVCSRAPGTRTADEAIMGREPFLVLADHLTRSGVAVLRFDDRGVGGSGGNLSNATHETQQRDASAALAWLQAQPEVDPTRVAASSATARAPTWRCHRRRRQAGPLHRPPRRHRRVQADLADANGRAAAGRGRPRGRARAARRAEEETIAGIMKKKPRPELEALARDLTRRQLDLASRRPPSRPSSSTQS